MVAFCLRSSHDRPTLFPGWECPSACRPACAPCWVSFRITVSPEASQGSIVPQTESHGVLVPSSDGLHLVASLHEAALSMLLHLFGLMAIDTDKTDALDCSCWLQVPASAQAWVASSAKPADWKFPNQQFCDWLPTLLILDFGMVVTNPSGIS